MAIGLNLGCGEEVIGGFINHDIAIDGVGLHDLSVYGDGSVDEIQCHHALEHVGRDEVQPVLREWYRVLRAGGKVLVTCPDIILCMKKFLRYKDENRWKPKFPNEAIWGCQTGEHEYHKTGFSMERLKRELEWAGFRIVSAEHVEKDHHTFGLRVGAVK